MKNSGGHAYSTHRLLNQPLSLPLLEWPLPEMPAQSLNCNSAILSASLLMKCSIKWGNGVLCTVGKWRCQLRSGCQSASLAERDLSIPKARKLYSCTGQDCRLSSRQRLTTPNDC